MIRGIVDRLTGPERTALGVLAIAWLAGSALQATGAGDGLARRVAGRLDPPLPGAAELAARLPPGDPRAGWYAAGLALKAERERAGAAPAPIDPATADRAAWDRLPGVGPRTAERILEHRARHGPFRSPEDLLAVRGIGPVTLERLRPWLEWGPSGPETAAPGAPELPDLNRVDAAFLTGLPHIGPQLAQRIVHERTARRGFRDWGDLTSIKGIGAARLRVLQNATRLAGPHGAATGRIVDERTP